MGGISQNDLWVLENAYVQASPQILEARAHSTLQKSTLPLREECALAMPPAEALL